MTYGEWNRRRCGGCQHQLKARTGARRGGGKGILSCSGTGPQQRACCPAQARTDCRAAGGPGARPPPNPCSPKPWYVRDGGVPATGYLSCFSAYSAAKNMKWLGYKVPNRKPRRGFLLGPRLLWLEARCCVKDSYASHSHRPVPAWHPHCQGLGLHFINPHASQAPRALCCPSSPAPTTGSFWGFVLSPRARPGFSVTKSQPHPLTV